MKQKRKLIGATLVVAAIVTFGAAALAAVGDSSDPLVTLSYLTDIFKPQVEQKVDEAIAANQEALKANLNADIMAWDQKIQKQQESNQNAPQSSSFSVITLSKGQNLVGSVGCEVMLRVGSATCVSDSTPGLIDMTDGTTLNNREELITNHLYMVTIESRSVTAKTDTVKLLVRGTYTIQ